VLRLDADTGNHAVVLKIYARGRATGENLGRAASSWALATNRCVWAAASCSVLGQMRADHNEDFSEQPDSDHAPARGLQPRGSGTSAISTLPRPSAHLRRSPRLLLLSGSAPRRQAAPQGQGAVADSEEPGRPSSDSESESPPARGPSAESPPLHRVVVSPRRRLGAPGGHARSRSGGRV
jgi:hypothetical protein